MNPGDIALIDLIQSDGTFKLRPALLLKRLPKYDDFLVCGISTQLNQYIKEYDEVLNEKDIFFDVTGLRKTSLIRLLFLAVVANQRIAGTIGKVPLILHQDLLQRLAKFIVS